LSIWGWMWRKGFFGKPFLEEFVRTYLLYIDILTQWASKIAPAANCPDGLSSGGTFEVVEYPMRFFQAIGNLGLLAIALAHMPDSEPTRLELRQVVEFLKNAIVNNPSRHRPLLDNHAIDIFLGMWPLLLTGHADLAKWWLNDLLEHMLIRKRFHARLPELNNNIDAVIEYEATGERPIDYVDSSSTLIYMLLELCLVLDDGDVYASYREAYEAVSFQVWYPPENVEGILYSQEVFEGDTEVIHRLPESFEEFRLDVQARHQFDRVDYSPVIRGLPTILLLASKHFRTPIFPFWWRTPLFSQQDSEEA